MRARLRSQLARFLEEAARQLARAGESRIAATHLARARDADAGLVLAHTPAAGGHEASRDRSEAIPAHPHFVGQ